LVHGLPPALSSVPVYAAFVRVSSVLMIAEKNTETATAPTAKVPKQQPEDMIAAISARRRSSSSKQSQSRRPKGSRSQPATPTGRPGLHGVTIERLPWQVLKGGELAEHVVETVTDHCMAVRCHDLNRDTVFAPVMQPRPDPPRATVAPGQEERPRA